MTDISLVRYFAQYPHADFHRTLLADTSRTEAFRDAIERCVKPGAVVLDLGAGTGVLSIFACRAGARRVYAVEADPNMAAFANAIVRRNGFGKRISVISEESRVATLPKNVDVLVSECIGCMMYGGNMISAVCDARDQILKPNGCVVPRKILLYAAPVEADGLYEHVNFLSLQRPYGIDFSPLRPSNNVYMTVLPPRAVIAEPQLIEEADLARGHPNEMLDATVEFTVRRPRRLHGFGLWFTVDLCDGVSLRTSPLDEPTAWKQAFISCGPEIPLVAGSKVTLHVKLSRTLMEDRSDINSLSWEVTCRSGRRVIRRAFSTKRSFWEWRPVDELSPRISGKVWNALLTEQAHLFQKFTRSKARRAPRALFPEARSR